MQAIRWANIDFIEANLAPRTELIGLFGELHRGLRLLRQLTIARGEKYTIIINHNPVYNSLDYYVIIYRIDEQLPKSVYAAMLAKLNDEWVNVYLSNGDRYE